MKPNEIYALEPIDISHQFLSVSSALQHISTNTGKDHALVSILDNSTYEIDELITAEKKFEVRTYMEEGDDKYGAILYAVFFDSKPLMIVQNNGRYYDTYETYVTDLDVLDKVTQYISSKVSIEETLPGVYDPNEEIEGLEQVGSYNLHNYYVSGVEPEYKKGDIVWAWVLENHLLTGNYYDNYKGYVLTQVLITQVHPHKPQETYWGTQTQRGWDDDHNMALNAKSCGIGCSLNDKMIVGKVSDIPMPDLAVNNFVDEKGCLPETYKMEAPIQKTSKPKMK